MPNDSKRLTKVTQSDVIQSQFETNMTKLENMKNKANSMVQSPDTTQEEKKSFRTDKARKALTKIMNKDFTSEKWIKQKKGKRDTRKNIQATYRKITGDTSFFGGLSRADKDRRRSEFEERRAISMTASLSLANSATADFGDTTDVQGMIESLSQVDVERFDIVSDRDFVDNFATNYPILQRAELLLDHYRTKSEGDGQEGEQQEKNQDIGLPEELALKLYWMKSIKEAYLERITIISSPYYVSMRDADFTQETRNHMRRQLNNKDGKNALNEKDRMFYEAYLHALERKEGTLEGRYNFRFKTGAKGEKMNTLERNKFMLRLKFYQDMKNNPAMMKGFDHTEDKDESDNFLNRFFDQYDKKEKDSNARTPLQSAGSKLLSGNKLLVREALYEGSTNSNDIQLTKEAFKESIKKISTKLDFVMNAHRVWEENRIRFWQDEFNRIEEYVEKIQDVNKRSEEREFRIKQSERHYKENYNGKEIYMSKVGKEPRKLTFEAEKELKRVQKILKNIETRVDKGEISMDTARVWLDLTFDQSRLDFNKALQENDTEETDFTQGKKFSVTGLIWAKELSLSDLKKYYNKDYSKTTVGEEAKQRSEKWKVPPRYHSKDFIADQIGLAYLIARERYSRMLYVLDDSMDINHPLIRAEMKKVFKELMLLNGIDPETMTGIRLEDELNKVKKKGLKKTTSVSLTELLDKMDREQEEKRRLAHEDDDLKQMFEEEPAYDLNRQAT